MQHETTEHGSSCLPEPLTRRNGDGDVYERLPAVDKQIRDALQLDPEGLRGCLEIRDETSAAFLREESLVYLIRYYQKVGNRQLVNDLSTCLVDRCATSIYGRLPSLGADVRNDGYSEVVEELFTKILDLGSNRGDFLQVRFGLALKRITIQVFRRLVKRSRSESSYGYGSQDIDAITKKGSVVVTAPILHRSAESTAIENSLIREALSQLEEPIRSAYLLRHYSGWPIEDRDPAVRTISRYFGKTPRTIRNWLSRADGRLEAWRGEHK